MTDIQPSEWGFTAYAPNGRAIAHSRTLELLEDYLGGKVTTHGPVDGVAGGVPGGEPVPAAVPAVPGGEGGTRPSSPAGSPLTQVTYTTRARSTGATASAGRTASGFGVQCLNHGTLAPAQTKTAAETAVSRPQEWCPGCYDIAAGLAPKFTTKIDPTELEDLL